MHVNLEAVGTTLRELTALLRIGGRGALAPVTPKPQI